MYYQTDDQFGLTFDQVRKMFPGVSFPASGGVDMPDVRSYTPAHTPLYDPATHAVREVAPVGGVQQWEVYPLTKKQVQENAAAAVIETREQAKAARQAAVDAIVVTTHAGNTFDGDETSQTRMARAIIALQTTGTSAVTWVLADNSVIQATAAELSEALALAGAKQAEIWVI